MNTSWLRLVALGLGLVATPVSAQEFTLKLHHFLGENAPAHQKMLAPWARQVEENSGGKVKIEIYPSMTLGGRPQELVQQARNGIVDIIWTLNGYTPGLFSRTEVFELPNVYVNDIAATNLAMRELFESDLADDYKGLEVMFLHVHAGNAIQTAETEVRTPADMEGLSIRIPTRTGAWLLEELGSEPVSMPVPDLPQALSKRVVDGALIPFEIIPALNLQQQTKFQIEGNDETRFGTSVFQVSMSRMKWDTLPDDVKQAFRDASGDDWLKQMGEVWRSVDDHGIKVATEAGNTHIVLDAEQTQAFAEAMAPVVDRWIEDVSSKGIDGAGIVERARASIQKHGGKAPATQ